MSDEFITRQIHALADNVASTIRSMREEIVRITSERDAAMAIINGSKTPPTDAEIEEHNGPWVCSAHISDGFAVTVANSAAEAKILADRILRNGYRGYVWHRWDGTAGRPVASRAIESAKRPIGVKLPDADRTYAMVVEHARQLALGETPDDFEIARTIDARGKR